MKRKFEQFRVKPLKPVYTKLIRQITVNSTTPLYDEGFKPILKECSKEKIPKTLILGSFPSVKSFAKGLSAKDIIQRGGEGPQNFGHPRNSFFNIVGSALGFKRHETPYNQQKNIFVDSGYALWDVIAKCSRPGSLDSSIDFKKEVKFASIDPPIDDDSLLVNNIPRFIEKLEFLERIVFHKTAAGLFTKAKVWKLIELELLKCNPPIIFKISQNQAWTVVATNKIFKKKLENLEFKLKDKVNVRCIEVIVLISTSPAAASIRPYEKEKEWHKSCFNLSKPIESYFCPGCNKISSHWFNDCKHLISWKKLKQAENKRKNLSVDPYRWYL